VSLPTWTLTPSMIATASLCLLASWTAVTTPVFEAPVVSV
jgi:hypothetical protein